MSDESKEFSVDKKTFTQQYSQLYFQRLSMLKSVIIEKCQEKWKSECRKDRLFDVNAGETCYVIGTVFVDSSLKPNVLNEIAKEVFHFSLMKVSFVRV